MDWLITRGEANTREEATDIGRQLVDAGVFRHGEREETLQELKRQRERERERERERKDN